jgi:hypothetical protein
MLLVDSPVERGAGVFFGAAGFVAGGVFVAVAGREGATLRAGAFFTTAFLAGVFFAGAFFAAAMTSTSYQ